MGKNKKILIVAGEASGDLHASNLVEAIKKIHPDAEFFGLGGEKLASQGVRLYCNIVDLAVVGIFEVLKNLNKFRAIFDGILKETEQQRPDLAILVDYPGFNMRLAKKLKERNIPVIYYISPQVWAWGEKRIHAIKEMIRHMLVVFQFEETLYKNNKVNVSFVGHPLLEEIKIDLDKKSFLDKFNLDPNKQLIALLPGSRDKEVKTLLPIMLKSAKLLDRNNLYQFIILRSSSVNEELFKEIMQKHNFEIPIISGATHNGINASDFAIVASGTATLETGIIGTPMVIVYKVSFLTWLIVKSMIKIPYIGLVNVVLGRKVIPEFIQFGATPSKIACYMDKALSATDEKNRIKKELAKIRTILGEKHASAEAAKIIARYL